MAECFSRLYDNCEDDICFWEEIQMGHLLGGVVRYQ